MSTSMSRQMSDPARRMVRVPLIAVGAVVSLILPIMAVPGGRVAAEPSVVCVRTFDYAGVLQSYTVPSSVASVIVDAYGAEGGDTVGVGIPGKGGYVRAVLAVTPSETLYVSVGQKGAKLPAAGGGSNFGGGGGSAGGAGQGGGATDVRQGGTALGNRVLVAGGGGGAGRGEIGAHGGDGGHPAGLKGQNSPDGNDEGGFGGTQTAGGAPGSIGSSTVSVAATAGSLGQGGNGGKGTGSFAENYTGGGGGGGYYGGGGGKGGRGNVTATPYIDGAGGGGGSSFGPAGSQFATGIRVGHGQVVITAIGPDCETVEPGYPSNDCDGPGSSPVVNFQSGDSYAKVRTAPDSEDAGALWVCLAADGGTGTAHIGGKAVVEGSPLLLDDEQAACHADGEPSSPQHFEGTFGPDDTPVHLDLVVVDEGPLGKQVWVCALAGDAAKRLVILGKLVRFERDDIDHVDPPTTTTSSTSSTTTSSTTTTSTTTTTIPAPPAGEPSRYCLDNGGEEVLNSPAGDGRVWVYTLQAGSSAHVCVRFQTGEPGGDPEIFGGGHLSLDPVGQQAVVVEERSDFTTDPEYPPNGPCDLNVLNITSNPKLIVKVRNPAHGSPAYLCVRADETARRFRIDASEADTLVDFDQDIA